MRNGIFFLLLLLSATAFAGVNGTVDYQSTGSDLAYDLRGGIYNVNYRWTCTKSASNMGLAGSLEVTVWNALGDKVGTESEFYEYCPTADDLDTLLDDYFGFSLDPPPPRAAIQQITTPAENRLYVADSTGPRGRASVDVMNTQTLRIIATIDVDDRLFGGLVVAPDGQKTYALMWQTTLPPSPGPAFIGVIDNGTNQIADRILLPNLLEPQKPALSGDGRYLYFAARTATVGHRVQIVDLQTKAIVGVMPAASPATVEPRAAALSPDGALLCTSAQQGVICYDVRTRTVFGRVALSLPNSNLRPAFHPNGSRLYVLGRATVAGGVSNFISVIDTSTLTEITRVPITNPAPADFRDTLVGISVSPNGSRLLINESFKGTLTVIDTRTNTIEKTVEGLSNGSLASGFGVRR